MRVSDRTTPKPDLDRPATYQITVLGRLDERWSDWFGHMTITTEREGNGRLITTLTGTVADQAALQGMLRALYNLGLSVRSVTCIESGGVAQPGPGQGREG
jgi:hypothetical protein